jgi:hypothetical protein
VRRNFYPGFRYGRWTLIEKTDRRHPQGYVVWSCRCDCGTSRHVSTHMLKPGGSSSCGCARKEAAAKVCRVDLAGKRFGRLIAQESVGSSKNRSLLWKCQCDCGETAIVEGRHLRYGNTISCGCAAGSKSRIRPANVAEANIAYQSVRRSRQGVKRFTPDDILRIYAEQSGCCTICHVPVSLASAHRDHIIPLALGGENTADNIQILCKRCNLSKGSKHPAVFLTQHNSHIITHT